MSDIEPLGAGQGDSDDIYALREEPDTRPVAPLPSSPAHDDDDPSPARMSAAERAAEKAERERLAHEAARSAPPTWLFLRRTFTFPFRTSSLVCTASLALWAILSLGLPLATLLGPPESIARAVWVVVLVISGQIVLLLLWFLLGSNVGLTILRDTSYGNDDVEHWPGVSDGVTDAFFLISSVMMSAGAGSVLGKLGLMSVPLAAGLGLLVLFPIVLLSMLETNSPINPCSVLVWRSLAASWRAWAMFYVVTILGGAVVIGITVLVARHLNLVAGSLIVGPLAALSWMIYFRMLGRLAWFCTGGTAEGSEDDEDEA